VTDELELTLQRAQAGGKLQAREIAAGLVAVRERNFRRFDAGEPVEELIRATSMQIDRVLETCFTSFVDTNSGRDCSLVAVGGYGRDELLPGSKPCANATFGASTRASRARTST